MAFRAEATRCGRRRWRIASLMVLAVCLAATACDRGRPADRIGDTRGAPQARSASPFPTLPDAGAEPDLPKRGTALVWLSASGVTVLANRAPRMRVLEDLGREAGFEVAIGAGERPTGSITLRAVEVPLEQALARLLQEVPYTLHYDAVTQGEEASLVRVAFVATGDEGKVTERRNRSSDSRRRDRDRALASREEKREVADPARLEDQQREAIRDLEDERREVRIDAAESLYPDAAGIDALAEALKNDPEPAVRVAAAESLGYSVEDPAALSALLRALGDPDPGVLLAALDGIEFVGDHTVIPEIQFLLEHPNAEVRQATVDAIDWLEE